VTGGLDRVPVPTNGKRPRHVDEPPPSAPPTRSSPNELTVTFTPAQIAVGFGIIASLVLLAARQLRRRGRRGRR
jgi:hypothetical protein